MLSIRLPLPAIHDLPAFHGLPTYLATCLPSKVCPPPTCTTTLCLPCPAGVRHLVFPEGNRRDWEELTEVWRRQQLDHCLLLRPPSRPQPPAVSSGSSLPACLAFACMQEATQPMSHSGSPACLIAPACPTPLPPGPPALSAGRQGWAGAALCRPLRSDLPTGLSPAAAAAAQQGAAAAEGGAGAGPRPRCAASGSGSGAAPVVVVKPASLWQPTAAAAPGMALTWCARPVPPL